ncbi:MAG: OsmC family protein [Metallosphaera yellowstonensis]
MEISLTLFGDEESPRVQIGSNVRNASDLYLESPLMAFLTSIPHCVFNAVLSVSRKEGITLRCRVRAKYVLDDGYLKVGDYVIRKVILEVEGGGCSKDELKEVVEKVKRECPIYLSFRDRMEINPIHLN